MIDFLLFGLALNFLSFIISVAWVITSVSIQKYQTLEYLKAVESIKDEYIATRKNNSKFLYFVEGLGLFIPFVFAYKMFSISLSYSGKANYNYLGMIYLEMVDKMEKMGYVKKK